MQNKGVVTKLCTLSNCTHSIAHTQINCVLGCGRHKQIHQCHRWTSHHRYWFEGRPGIECTLKGPPTFIKYTVDYIYHLVIHVVLYSSRHLMNGWDLKSTPFPWLAFKQYLYEANSLLLSQISFNISAEFPQNIK